MLTYAKDKLLQVVSRYLKLNLTENITEILKNENQEKKLLLCRCPMSLFSRCSIVKWKV